MRTALFRDSGDRDWGLPPWSDRLRWSDGLAAFPRFMRGEFRQLWEGRRLRRRVLESGKPVLMSVGSGRSVPPGWIGIDFKRAQHVYRCDLTRPLPIPECTVDGILAEHILEHFPLDDLPAMLADYHRILKPGAPLRIASPDALIVAAIILGQESDRTRSQYRFETRVHRWDQDELFTHKVFNRIAYQFGQHQSLLTAATMRILLEQAGFVKIREPGTAHTDHFGHPPSTHFTRFPDSTHEVFVVEAVKP